MAGPGKKRHISDNEQQQQQQSSESEEENQDVYTGDEVIEADFEGRNPDLCDFHGIKQLLQQLFLKAHVNLSELSDLLIAQNNVGSVLKQSVEDPEDSDEDDGVDVNDVFGITSVINLTVKKNVECIQQLRNLLVELAEEHGSEEVNSFIHNILGNDSKHVGLLINERFVNIPARVSDPLFESLYHEIQKANVKKLHFNFAYYILICKLHKKDNKDDKNEQDLYYSNAEEEIIDQGTDMKFEFSVKSESDSSISGHWLEEDETMTPYRRVLIFPAEKFSTLIAQMKEFVAG